jgi:hypothetical protein
MSACPNWPRRPPGRTAGTGGGSPSRRSLGSSPRWPATGTLPPYAFALIRRLAAFGAVVTPERLAECGEPIKRVVDALATTRRHGLLAETRHPYRFRYPLIHELLVLSLGRSERRLWGSDGYAVAS